MVIRNRLPSMLSLSNGKMKFISVKRRSKCAKCRSDIMQNQQCGELNAIKGGFRNGKRYCLSCADGIIETTKSELKQIEANLQAATIHMHAKDKPSRSY